MTGVYDLTLRALNGRERRMLAWLPTEQVRQDFHEKARRNGIEIMKSEKLKEKREKLNKKLKIKKLKAHDRKLVIAILLLLCWLKGK